MGYVKKTDLNKPWAKKESVVRNAVPKISIKNIFLVYCEGENTEPIYFKSFPISSETKIEVVGTGRSRTSLVNHVIDLTSREELLYGQKNYDPDRQIWCVFDKDVKNLVGENEDFNNAIMVAGQNGIQVAYSNDAFELWFLLHDNYLDTALTRHNYYDILSGKYDCNYEKIGKTIPFCKSLYSLYLPTQKEAIRNAARLHKSYGNEILPADKIPCTTVYLLVQELNKCLKK